MPACTHHESQFLTTPSPAEQPTGHGEGKPLALSGLGFRAGVDEVAGLDFVES